MGDLYLIYEYFYLYNSLFLSPFICPKFTQFFSLYVCHLFHPPLLSAVIFTLVLLGITYPQIILCICIYWTRHFFPCNMPDVFIKVYTLTLQLFIHKIHSCDILAKITNTNFPTTTYRLQFISNMKTNSFEIYGEFLLS